MYSTYFLNLDKYLNKDFDAEQLLNLYKKNYKDKNIKVVIHYMDSWGHLWKGKYAWPKEEWFIECPQINKFYIMHIDIRESLIRTYRIDRETLQDFKENSKDLTKDGLLDYLTENYYWDDFLIDEDLKEVIVDSDDFNNFKANE